VFETYYPEPAERQQAAERYSDIPLGVEAAWPPHEEPAEASSESRPAA
jgi:hypothetical protein